MPVSTHLPDHKDRALGERFLKAQADWQVQAGDFADLGPATEPI